MTFRIITRFLSTYPISPWRRRQPISILSNFFTSLPLKTSSFSSSCLASPSLYQINQNHSRHFHSNSVGDWSPRYRSFLRDWSICSLYDCDDYADFDYRHWRVFLRIIGLEFTTEEALFDLYIKTLAPFVGR
ncbi:hypothetical protein ACHQM5_018345 [Ranunculus cassubicifolius]